MRFNESWSESSSRGAIREGKIIRPFAFFRSQRKPNYPRDHAPILQFHRVYKNFRKGVPTLCDINFTVNKGEFVFITGPSGAGKSTLLQLVYRRRLPDDGQILFCGRDVAALQKHQVPGLRRNLGIVFQDFRIIRDWSVFENVAVALEVLGMPNRVIDARVREALERVGLGGREEDRAGSLSGGEQQRVSIARAIVTEPAMILADEPTGNLDGHLALDILTLFEEIHASGTTVLFATHDHALIEQRSHRILAIDNGRVIEARRGLESWPARQNTGDGPEPQPNQVYGLRSAMGNDI